MLNMATRMSTRVFRGYDSEAVLTVVAQATLAAFVITNMIPCVCSLPHHSLQIHATPLLLYMMAWLLYCVVVGGLEFSPFTDSPNPKSAPVKQSPDLATLPPPIASFERVDTFKGHAVHFLWAN